MRGYSGRSARCVSPRTPASPMGHCGHHGGHDQQRDHDHYHYHFHGHLPITPTNFSTTTLTTTTPRLTPGPHIDINSTNTPDHVDPIPNNTTPTSSTTPRSGGYRREPPGTPARQWTTWLGWTTAVFALQGHRLQHRQRRQLRHSGRQHHRRHADAYSTTEPDSRPEVSDG